VDAYIDGKRLHCSPRTIEFEEERLITLKRYFGDVPLTAITAKAIAEYQRSATSRRRQPDHQHGRRRAVARAQVVRPMARAGGPRAQPARTSASGRPGADARGAQRLFDSAASNPEWEHVYCAAVVAANTSMRPVEVKHLRRRDVDLVKKRKTSPHPVE
jgi:integrase